MAYNDPIADMLTRIRNAAHARHDKVTIPHSKIKEALARTLVAEGFLVASDVAGEGARRSIVVDLKYTPEGDPVFRNLERASKLGWRRYRGRRRTSAPTGRV